MTCIIGFVENSKIYMGADSASVAGSSLSIRVDKKIFKKDNMIFGFTSSFRMGQIIHHCLKIPEHRKDQKSAYEYLCSDFIDALIQCFKDKGFAEVNNNVVSGGHFLIGYDNTIFHIASDFQVGVPAANYWAVGCGSDLALGALYALENSKIPATKKIKRALMASAKFSTGVSEPFHIITL